MICPVCGNEMILIDVGAYGYPQMEWRCANCDTQPTTPDPEADLSQYPARDLQRAMVDYFWLQRRGGDDQQQVQDDYRFGDEELRP